MKPKLLLCLALVLSGDSNAAIIYPKAPDGGKQIVYKYAGEFPNSDPRFLGGFRIEELTIADPYENYSVGLTNLASGEFLSATKSNGSWTYIFMHGTDVVGDAWLMSDEKTGKALKAYGLGSSVFSEETPEALRIVEQLPQIKKSDYEIRRLAIPAESFVAIWLHGKADDIIIPLPPTYGRLNAYQPYSENEIVKILKPEAKRDMEMWAKLNEQKQKNEEAYRQAMMEYEKAHGDKCGSIISTGMSGPFQVEGPDVEILTLQGTSSECGKLDYKVKITYGDNRGIVKNVEVLEKITQ